MDHLLINKSCSLLKGLRTTYFGIVDSTFQMVRGSAFTQNHKGQRVRPVKSNEESTDQLHIQGSYIS